jgi:hypothetical protein
MVTQTYSRALRLALLFLVVSAKLEAGQVRVARSGAFLTGRGSELSCGLRKTVESLQSSVRDASGSPDTGTREGGEGGERDIEIKQLRLRGGFVGFDDGFRQGSPTKMAVQRIQTELKAMLTEPSDFFRARPLDEDLLDWQFVLLGAPQTPFEGGLYHGRILLDDVSPHSFSSLLDLFFFLLLAHYRHNHFLLHLSATLLHLFIGCESCLCITVSPCTFARA